MKKKRLSRICLFIFAQSFLIVHAENFCKLISLWPNPIDVSDLVLEVDNLASASSIFWGGEYFDLLPKPQSWPSAGWENYQTLTGDLNNDGRMDLVWNRTNASGNFIHVGLSNGDGTFNLLPDFQSWPIAGWTGFQSLIGDLDNDGRMDLIWNLTDASENTLSVGLSKFPLICLLIP